LERRMLAIRNEHQIGTQHNLCNTSVNEDSRATYMDFHVQYHFSQQGHWKIYVECHMAQVNRMANKSGVTIGTRKEVGF